jgi:hypothetical protein
VGGRTSGGDRRGAARGRSDGAYGGGNGGGGIRYGRDSGYGGTPRAVDAGDDTRWGDTRWGAGPGEDEDPDGSDGGDGGDDDGGDGEGGPPHRRRRRLALAGAGLLVAGLVAGLVAWRVGVFDEDEAPPDLTRATPPASAATPVDPGFCDGVTTLDQALTQVPDSPDLAAAYVAEKVTPTVAAVRAAMPPGDVGAQVETVLAAVESAAGSGDPAAFDSPEFAAAQAGMYPYVAQACGYTQISATASDDAFAGVPATLKAGRQVLLLTNQSTAGEFHEIAFVKLVPDTDIAVKDFMALPPEEADKLIDPASYGVGVYTAPGETSGAVVDLTPGRWVYACFVPQGTTAETPDGTGPPHADAGMYGEVAVS